MQFQKILVPTDFSADSERVVRLVPEIPGVAQVILAHIMAATPYASRAWKESGTSTVEEVYARIKPLQETIEGQGIPVTTVVETIGDADISAAIVSLAERENVDLIVMAPRGKGIDSDVPLGSVSAGVFRSSEKNLLFIPSVQSVHDLFSRVLFPTDFSNASVTVFEQLTQGKGVREILLLHVVSDTERTDMQQLHAQAAEKEFSLLTSRLEKSGITARAMVRFGKPSAVILDAAEKEGATLILMSRIGRMDSVRNLPLGEVTARVAKGAQVPLLVPFIPVSRNIQTRELRREEFPLAEEIWLDYHQTKADPEHDRIFGVFVDGTLVSIARCKRHPDGYEVDAIFTPQQYRGHGYANKAVGALVEACHHDPLYMHSVLNLLDFYAKFGFEQIPESDLPPTIKARFDFAMGALEGANVRPMRRLPKSII